MPKKTELELTPAEDLHWYLRRAGEGDVQAQRELGRMFLHGFTHPDDSSVELQPDSSKALQWLSQAAEGGDGEAAFLLGTMFDGKATGGSLDEPETAFARYQQAVDLGYRPARFFLGTRHLLGRGTARNDRLGREILIEAAYAGDTDAQAFLVEIYRRDGDEVSASAWTVVAMLFGSQRFEGQRKRRAPRRTPAKVHQIVQKVRVYSLLVDCDAPPLLQAADLLRESFADEI